MAHEYAKALLLADVVQFPRRNKGDHKAQPTDAETNHGITEPNEYINEFAKVGLVRDKHPNFFRMGFQSQAFIDIHLSSSTQGDGFSSKIEEHVKTALRAIDNIVFIYTVFGEVDLRCKVVGMTLRDVERTAMRIREIPGVETSSTSIILDETEYDDAPERWGKFIREHAKDIDHFLPKPSRRKGRTTEA